MINNTGFRKTMKMWEKHRDIKLVTTERRRNYLMLEPNCHTTKFAENVLPIEMKKTHIFMNKPVYLGILILELIKMLMYQFWYDCVKPKHGEKAKLVYMDTDISLSTFHFITYGYVSLYI